MDAKELEELISNCPTLFHMAERGSWKKIENRGLLSTSALLAEHNVPMAMRAEIGSKHRQKSVKIADGVWVRDQKPMSDESLRKCLPSHLEPSDWYKTLNSKVFFWLSETRLHKLAGATAYRNREHDVIEVDTRSLIEAHFDKIWLCPINSGCTKPFPTERDEKTFARICDYPYSYWRKKRAATERVFELCVDQHVLDISNHVKRVVIKKNTIEVKAIYFRP